jgi:phosphomannomutase
LVTEIMSRRGCPLSKLVDERMMMFPASGEINRKVPDAQAALDTLEGRYRDGALAIDHTDGLSMEFHDWRFNLRASNTEPLVRLNVESRRNEGLMAAKTQELLQLIGGEPG